MASWPPRVPGLGMGPKGQLSSWALALDLPGPRFPSLHTGQALPPGGLLGGPWVS